MVRMQRPPYKGGLSRVHLQMSRAALLEAVFVLTDILCAALRVETAAVINQHLVEGCSAVA